MSITVLDPVRVGGGVNTGTGQHHQISGIVNIFMNWSSQIPVAGSVNYIPALVIENSESVPVDTPPGTVIFIKG
jgi:hypothetical protein